VLERRDAEAEADAEPDADAGSGEDAAGAGIWGSGGIAGTVYKEDMRNSGRPRRRWSGLLRSGLFALALGAVGGGVMERGWAQATRPKAQPARPVRPQATTPAPAATTPATRPPLGVPGARPAPLPPPPPVTAPNVALPARPPAAVTLPPSSLPVKVAAGVEGDVPPIPAQVPPKLAVAPFENHSTVDAMQWMVAAAPFEIAEKSEQALKLEPAYGPLVVGAPILPNEKGVLELAKVSGAQLVITGWVEKPNANLRLVAQLWKVSAATGTAGASVKRVAQAERLFPREQYHAMLGEVLADLWTEGGFPVGEAEREILGRPMVGDAYAVQLFGRGLGYLSGALGVVDLKAAEKDLAKAVLIAPKLAEAQRITGELLLAQAQGDAKVIARASGKFSYATDLRPDYVPALRAAAASAAAASKREVALELTLRLVKLRPWDLELRYQLGAALWSAGDDALAERELGRVLERQPGNLPARRVLALIHSARGATAELIGELEAIQRQAPEDLEVKLDLASVYSASGLWRKAEDALIAVSRARPLDVPLLVRIGDVVKERGTLDDALPWYQRAMKVAPDAAAPGFAQAQALYDARRFDEAHRAYTSLQRFRPELGATLLALGSIGILRRTYDEAAWHLRRAVREAPRNLATRQAAAAAELLRRDAPAALLQLEPALRGWPQDATLHYLLGLARSLQRDKVGARAELALAVALDPRHDAARAALAAVDLGGDPAVVFSPAIERPWGDAAAISRMVARYDAAQGELLAIRAQYQTAVISILGLLGQGPLSPPPAPPPRGIKGVARPVMKRCPLRRIAPEWKKGQELLSRYARRGASLEEAYRFLARHDDAGYGAGLLPDVRARLGAARRSYRTATADLGELRAEWQRGVVAELRKVRCSDALLQAALDDPRRFPMAEDDKPQAVPAAAARRPPGRAMFYVDNTECPDPATVWVDGESLGTVEAGKRSAFVAEPGERTLCLTLPDSAACGDRGTVRQVYLYDDWTVTMNCPK
jgi:tetratricopeptide (TPR) repeat protein